MFLRAFQAKIFNLSSSIVFNMADNRLDKSFDKNSGGRRCISCGKPAEVGYFCRECFLRENPVILAFPEFDIVQCPACGRFFYENSWHNSQIEKAVERLLISRLKLNQDYFKFSFDFATEFPEHSKAGGNSVNGILNIKVSASPKSSPKIELSDEYEVPARLTYKTCPLCKTGRPEYFEATIQLRHPENETPDGREAFEGIAKMIREESAKHAGQGLRISKEEKFSKGIDFKLTKNSYALQVARSAAERFGAQVEINERLFSQDRSGRRLYRMTALIVAPNFVSGSIVNFNSGRKNGIYKVISTGRSIRLEDLQNGSNLILNRRSAAGLSALPKIKAQVLKRFPRLELLNPETFQPIIPENLKNKKLVANALSKDYAWIVLVGEKAYLI